jgi:uncharacterized protein (TIGR00255 family)
MMSMTGFGRGEASNGAVTVIAELKAVNNRFRDIQLRLPREYNALEPRVLNLLREVVNRGRVDVAVRRSGTEAVGRVVADPRLAEQVWRAAHQVAQRLQQPEVPLSFVLSWPGVLVATESEADVLAEWDVLEAALRGALGDLAQMRANEGAALARDLERHLDELARLRGEVETAQTGVAERLSRKLVERVQRLVSERVDPVRLAQEAALLGEKCDVSEELARLASHADQLRAALTADEPMGRKVDFLLQELNREVNTLGAKSADPVVSLRVVDMKAVLEKMREQAQNVE